jgi:hypothetical protein
VLNSRVSSRTGRGPRTSDPRRGDREGAASGDHGAVGSAWPPRGSPSARRERPLRRASAPRSCRGCGRRCAGRADAPPQDRSPSRTIITAEARGCAIGRPPVAAALDSTVVSSQHLSAFVSERSHRTSRAVDQTDAVRPGTGRRRPRTDEPVIRRKDTRQGKRMSAARYQRRHRPCRERWNRACT